MARAALVAIVVLVVVAGGYWLRLHATLGAYRDAEVQQAVQDRLLHERQRQARSLDSAQAALADEQQRVQEARWRLSGGEGMSEWLDQLAHSGRVHGLVVEQLDIGDTLQAVGYRQMPLRMRVIGSYAALRVWLDEWLQQLRTLEVMSMQWATAVDRPGLLQLDIQLHAFDAGEAVPVPGSLADRPARPVRPAPALDPFTGWSPRHMAQPGLAGVPLEQLEMVGSLSRVGQTQALVRWAGGLHRVAEGDRLGREEGEVVRVDPEQIEVRERIFNDGAWQETSRYLSLSRHRRAGSRQVYEKTGDRAVGIVGAVGSVSGDGDAQVPR